MKQILKYASVAFALVLAVSIIGSCLTAGMALIRAVAQNEDWSVQSDGNFLWHRTEDGDVVFLGIRFDGGDVKSGTEQFPVSEVTSLTMDKIRGEVIVELWDGENVVVEYSDIPGEYKIQNHGGTLTIKGDNKFSWFSVPFSAFPKIHVKIPKECTLKTVKVDKGSGSMKMYDVSANSVYVENGSGSLTISGVDTSKLTVDSGSGSVKVSNTVAKELRVDSGSGSVRFTDITAEKMTLDSGSGSVKYTGHLSGDCEFQTGSGSVSFEIYGKEEDYNIRADLGSGGLYINGEKQKDDANIKHKGAKHLLVVEAGSGRVSINFTE